MNFLISDAWAQAPTGGVADGGLLSLLPLVLIFVVFYFLLIRPQQKRAQEHKKMGEGIKSGDEVVTNGGTLGKITGIGEQFVTLEVAAGVEIKVQRQAIQMMLPKGTMKSA